MALLTVRGIWFVLQSTSEFPERSFRWPSTVICCVSLAVCLLVMLRFSHRAVQNYSYLVAFIGIAAVGGPLRLLLALVVGLRLRSCRASALFVLGLWRRTTGLRPMPKDAVPGGWPWLSVPGCLARWPSTWRKAGRHLLSACSSNTGATYVGSTA